MSTDFFAFSVTKEIEIDTETLGNNVAAAEESEY